MKNLVFSLLLLPTISFGQWTSNSAVNTPICTQTGVQAEPAITTDGEGGAIIAWYDNRTGSSWDMYVQRIDAYGIIQWTIDGVAINTGAGLFDYYPRPTIVSDDQGGAIVTWHDKRNGVHDDIYAQRINSLGISQWTLNGVKVTASTTDDIAPVIISDGNSGAFISWNQFSSPYDIYAQHIDNTGALLWGTNGMLVCNAAQNQQEPVLIQDGSGGIIIAWSDDRALNGDIYVQHLNSSGTPTWNPNGVVVCGVTENQFFPTMVPDGNSGAIISWYDDRPAGINTAIYAQRVNQNGNMVWSANGIPVCANMLNQSGEQLVSDGTGGAIITWAGSNVAAQRVDGNGVLLWNVNGIELCTMNYNPLSPKIQPDGSGGAVVVWTDYRNSHYDLFAQRVNSSGNIVWQINGVPVCTAQDDQYGQTFITDPSFGTIATWYDNRFGSTNRNIYAQNISPSGVIGPYIFGEVNVTGNNLTIQDGDTTPSLLDFTDFGIVAVNATLTHTYVIQNTGIENLVVGPISANGTGSSAFTVSPLNPPSPIPVSGSASFTVTFHPALPGLQSSSIQFACNDADEGNFDFAIQGNGFSPDSNAVGIGTTNPELSSILDIQSTTKGILIPRMSSAERIALINPAEGLFVYDLNLHAFFYFDGNTWKKLKFE